MKDLSPKPSKESQKNLLIEMMKEDEKNGMYETKVEQDLVNHPPHYTQHPSGIECIQVTEHFNFCIGSAIKYLWRNGLKAEEGKGDKEKQIEDLKKAVWYISREIERLSRK